MAVPTEIHHSVPQCLLRLRDRADAASLDGEGIELALEFEHEAARYGVDPEFVSVYRPNSRSERPPHPLFRQFLYRVLRSSRLAPIAVIMLTVERLTRRFSLGGKKE